MAKPKKDKQKLKVAVIGVGNMGKHHARVYQENPDTELVAVADLDEKLGRETAEKFATKYYQDYIEMLKKEKPAIVSVSVPTKWHRDVALDVINSGANVLVEKPIAGSLEEASEIISAANEKGVKLTVGHIERFNPVVLKLKEMVDRGDLGTLVSIMARRANVIPNRIKDANVILDIGVHDIDLLNFILDRKPSNVYASGGRAILRKHEDYADIFLEYPDKNDNLKVTGHIQVNWLTPVKIRKLNVTGTKGYAVANLITQELILFNADYTSEFDNFEDYIGQFKESSGKKINVQIVEPLRAQIESFVAAVKDNKKILMNPEDALHALRIATLATENIRLKEGRV